MERTIEDVLQQYGDWAHGGDIEGAAADWADGYEFTPREVERWLNSRCFNPIAADDLKSVDVTPEQAAKRVDVSGYTDTIGYHYANGDMVLLDAMDAAKEAE